MATYTAAFTEPERHTRQILTEFIKLYEKHPCIWDTRSEDYSDKVKREEAFNELIKKYKELQEDAGILDVKRKIENLRSAYRREHKKVLQSVKNGYKRHRPILWYYEHMSFLNVLFNPLSLPSTLDDNSSSQVETLDIESETEDSDAAVKVEYENEGRILPRLLTQKRKLSDSYETIPTIYLPQPQEDGDADDIDYGDGEESMTEHKDSKVAKIGTTASEAFGKTVGLQLNELDPLQKMIAEKLISDVIFNARLQKLTVSSFIQIPRE